MAQPPKIELVSVGATEFSEPSRICVVFSPVWPRALLPTKLTTAPVPPRTKFAMVSAAEPFVPLVAVIVFNPACAVTVPTVSEFASA